MGGGSPDQSAEYPTDGHEKNGAITAIAELVASTRADDADDETYQAAETEALDSSHSAGEPVEHFDVTQIGAGIAERGARRAALENQRIGRQPLKLRSVNGTAGHDPEPDR
jgi:hypothetical protein